MGLPYIDKQALIAEAGGDPWAINASLQAGSPSQISNLAEAFHRAGLCTQETDNAFQQARSRFDAAWNHQDGGHPINDSEEVQRVTKALGVQSLQLPKIGADLEGIAAVLAEAQKAGAARIATLDAQLKTISDLVIEAVALLNDKSLSPADRDALHALINTCENDALRDTKAALADLQAIRNGYADGLQKSLNSLHAEGYDGAPLHGVDADGVAPASPAQQAAWMTFAGPPIGPSWTRWPRCVPRSGLWTRRWPASMPTGPARRKARPRAPSCPSAKPVSPMRSTTSARFPTTPASTPRR